MRKFLALTVITAGLLALNQAFWTHQPQNREDRLADMTRILTGSAGSVERQPAAAGDVKLAAIPATSPPPSGLDPAATDTGVHGRAPDVTGALPSPSTPPPAPAAQPSPPPVSPWQTAIATDPAVQPPDANGRTAEPVQRTPELTQRELILAIQSELKRVRCYDGASDGSWGSKSKQALQRFIERANASLPIREPDIVHLSLLQAQRGAVCGTCPKGQSLDGNGSCVPNAILARATLKNKTADAPQSGWEPAISGSPAASETAPARVAAEPGRPDLWGRMSVGGPVPPEVVGRSGIPPRPNALPPAETLAALESDGAVVDDAQSMDAPLDPNGDPGQNAGQPGYDPRDAQYRDPDYAPSERNFRQTAEPRPRANMRVSAPRPARAAKVRVHRSRDNVSTRYRSRGVRSVQSLFTHPLGRM